MSPVRVQLSRKKGWRKPEKTVVVSRPSKWGNPFAVGQVTKIWFERGDRVIAGALLPENRAEAVEYFRAWITRELGWPVNERLDLAELRGKNLACWCPLVDAEGTRVPCHADVLLEIANQGETR